ncbi:MAG: ATP-dependent Clp protease proteolytic subunit, partial [Lachnospiraceae bacterium]|nr:ATP-dependent Clp protease proteolytic subunit [Lachnospiraceae bacterium]
MKYMYTTDIQMNDDETRRGHRWIPTIEEESCHGTKEINLQTKHFTNRKIFLTGEVTEDMANDFVSQMLYLSISNEPVDIYINSPGGSVNAGLVIYDTIQACLDKCEINMYCIGMAASMGAVLL